MSTAKPGSAVRWATRPVAKGTPSSTCGCRACSRSSRLPRAMDGIRNSWPRWPKPPYSFSMTGDWPLSVMRTAATSLNSWKTVTAVARLLSPASSQMEHWHEALGNPTLADAILDCLLHNAYKIALRGESMRKRQAPVKTDGPATSPDEPRRRCAPMGDRGGAAFVRIGWQASSGLGGSFASDWVAGITGIRRRAPRSIPRRRMAA